VRTHLRAGAFRLVAYRRLTATPPARLVVYLEGDADAWHPDGLRVRAEPPPVRPVALELATRDPAPAVAWLARPCQLVLPPAAMGCEPSLWSHRRFAPEAIDAVDSALTALRRESGAAALELVGYSGGGVVATILAARRDDVASLVTVAAPLDLGAWVAHHDLGAMPDALDPAAIPPGRLADVAQAHLAGERDPIVPPAIVAGWLGPRPHGSARLVVVPGRGHDDWAEGWPALVAATRARLRP
jgi:pimeloyl-ACP methyl ester carboxylesterase